MSKTKSVTGQNGRSPIPKIVAGVFVLLVLVCVALGVYWSNTPALPGTVPVSERKVVGYATTETLIDVASVLLEKPGGYLSNDIAPPGLFLDNMPNWEFGVLVQIRDLARVMRNDLSRSQSTSVEDPDLAIAEPQFNYDSESWVFPSTEGEYREGLRALVRYRDRLMDPAVPDAQFYARADNLAGWLGIVEKRLGNLSQRLSASVVTVRENTDLAGDPAARQSTTRPEQIRVKTPWLQIDDVFYEARGTTWALVQFLRAAEVDFREVLEKKNALVSIRQIIRELEESQRSLRSPVVLNGSGFGILANHSLVMASYVAQAHAATIDLRELLQQG
ncbi:MAG: DUF2333 family protein [Pseudomonadota bacterium]|nr:DUF2333 family protein [Pseudomonadota bacterium]